jgi:hypothetical protein
LIWQKDFKNKRRKKERSSHNAGGVSMFVEEAIIVGIQIEFDHVFRKKSTLLAQKSR